MKPFFFPGEKPDLFIVDLDRVQAVLMFKASMGNVPMPPDAAVKTNVVFILESGNVSQWIPDDQIAGLRDKLRAAYGHGKIIEAAEAKLSDKAHPFESVPSGTPKKVFAPAHTRLKK